MKVPWLHHKISASVNINALLIIFLDGFNRITNYPGTNYQGILFGTKSVKPLKTATGHSITDTIKAGLVGEVYACGKKGLKSGQGYTEHRKTAKENRIIRHNHAKNRPANHQKFCMFRNTTISQFKTTVT